VSAIWASPLHVEDLIEQYAKLHPNPNPNEQDPEYGIYYQGDMRLGPDSMGTDSVRIGETFKWPNGIMPYVIDDVYTDEQMEQIFFGMTEIMRQTGNCVTFVPRTNEFNYVKVIKGGGCWSFVGHLGTGEQELSLEDGCFRHGTIMHEFLHAFGFFHEQSRGDRDDYVFINFDNIQEGRENNFRMEIEGEGIDHLGTLYDYGSVMHYNAYAFAIDRSIPTIIPYDPEAEIGQRLDLSELDAHRVMLHYGCA